MRLWTIHCNSCKSNRSVRTIKGAEKKYETAEVAEKKEEKAWFEKLIYQIFLSNQYIEIIAIIMSKPIAYQSLSKKTSSIEYKIWIIFFLLCVVGILIYKIGRIEVPSQSLTSESRNTNSHLQYKKLVPGLYE